jgi:hypothetical protein
MRRISLSGLMLGIAIIGAAIGLGKVGWEQSHPYLVTSYDADGRPHTTRATRSQWEAAYQARGAGRAGQLLENANRSNR